MTAADLALVLAVDGSASVTYPLWLARSPLSGTSKYR